MLQRNDYLLLVLFRSYPNITMNVTGSWRNSMQLQNL